MELSRRLKTVADMVTPGMRVADVGCDHGFVSVYLCLNKIAPKVYATDVREGPLKRAREHIESSGCTAYIETRLSDGLKGLAPGEADTLILAGMGGRLMKRILSEGADKVALMKELILQPQSEVAAFRAYLRTNGIVITREDMVEEEGKFYPVIKAVPGGAQESKESPQTAERLRMEDAFGPCLIKDRHSVLARYLDMLHERNRGILDALSARGMEGATPRTVKRRREIEREQEDIESCMRLLRG